MKKQPFFVLKEILATRNQYSDTIKNIERMFIFDGRVWKSKSSACSAYGLNVPISTSYANDDEFRNIIQNRLDKGKGREPSEELVEKNESLFYNGQYYRSPNTLANAYGVSRDKLYTLMKEAGMRYDVAMDVLTGRTVSGKVA